MMMSDSTLDAKLSFNAALSEHGSTVRHAGYELTDLANAAYLMGQDRLALRLSELSKVMGDSLDALNRAYGESVHADLVASEQATSNMIRGVLAGITLGEKSAA
jgi:hypothetical protein